MENMLKLGPKCMSVRTLSRGTTWDESGRTTIAQILISHEKDVINSIQFVYVVDGKVVRSEIHGEVNGSKFDIVNFNHTTEYLTSVSGQYKDTNFRRLVSITFGTNIRKYGPFGSVVNTARPQFEYNFTPRCSFGGFYGCVDYQSVYAIGVYVRPFETLAEIETYSGKGKDED